MQDLQVSLHQAQKYIPTLLKAGITPFLHGSPAVGKSSIVKQIADNHKLELIDVRLSQLEPTDLVGFPTFDGDKVTFKPVDLFPLQNDEIPEGKKGWLLFLDEANGASHSVQMASYKLILDRMVGNHKLHDKVFIISAGNLETDNAIVNTMSSALISRFAHFTIRLDTQEWLEWASSVGMDHRITSFIGFKPELLYTFNPNVTSPYASPRTWQMVSKIIKDSIEVPLLASMIGEGVAREFMTYLKLQDTLPSFDEIITNPTQIVIHEDLGTQWALMGMVVSKLSDKTAKPVSLFLERIPLEIQVCAMREISNRHSLQFLKDNMSDWFTNTARTIAT